jgi:hypothetical protein
MIIQILIALEIRKKLIKGTLDERKTIRKSQRHKSYLACCCKDKKNKMGGKTTSAKRDWQHKMASSGKCP